MTIKWNDTMERMMLIKVIEQNPGVKLNVNQALADWPADLDRPTKRGLGDRLATLKRHIRDGVCPATAGAPTALTPLSSSAGRTKPRTPTTARKSGSSTTTKVKPDPDASDSKIAPPKSSPNPISTTAGSSSIPFKSRLLGSSTKTTSKSTGAQGKKRKRDDIPEDSSTGSHDSSQEQDESEQSDTTVDNNTPTKSARGTKASRRSLPRRSKTPMTYREANDEETSEQDDSENPNKGKSSSINGDVNAGSGDDSDDAFDPAAARVEGTDGHKKHRKQSWKERIAMVDGHAAEAED